MKEMDLARCRLAKTSKEAAPEGKQDYWDSAAVVLKFVRRLNIVSADLMARFRDYYVSFICSNYSTPLRFGWAKLEKRPTCITPKKDR